MKYKQGHELNGGQAGGADLPRCVRLDVTQLQDRGGGPGPGSGGGGEFDPGSGGRGSEFHVQPSVETQRRTPEKKLTLFALRLAVLEKAASGLGKLAFVWATVVLLGGFASDLNLTDFWCITFILVGECARVFGRSHELEWQHHATCTSTAGGALRSSSRFIRRILHAVVHGDAPNGEARDHDPESQTSSSAGGTLRSSCNFFRRRVHALLDPAGAVIDGGDGRSAAAQFQLRVVASMKQRTLNWHAPDVPLVPYTGWVFVARKVGRLHNWLQVLSAFACVALSLMRFWKHDFGNGDGNMRPALLLFYALALLEASLFLLEQAYWSWKFSVHDLLRQVSDESGLGEYGPVTLRRFFYDAYSRCIAGSIFDGIKMDLVTFAQELIQSDFQDEQLIGVRILEQFTKKARSSSDTSVTGGAPASPVDGKESRRASDTLRKLGTSPQSIERLVEMLNWKRVEEKEVRRCAAEVVSKLAGSRQNALRVSSIPGAVESIMSLLYTGRRAPVSGTHPQSPCAANDDPTSPPSRGYDFLPFNLQGLLILKKLSRDHDYSGKIGNVRGLLAKIIELTHASQALLTNQHATHSQVRAVKRALEVVSMLVSTTGNTGKSLRQAVAENVFTVSNLRNILRHGRQHWELQNLAVDVLTALAMDKVGKEAIVGTGEVVKLLVSMFASGAESADLACKAGNALTMLALESERGCTAILKRTDMVDLLVSVLQQGNARRLNAASLLRNLCAYSGDTNQDRLHAVTRALPAVLKATMADRDEILEVSIGLTTQICEFIDGERFAAELRRAGVMEDQAYVRRLVTILQRYKYPEIRVPRMRRFVLQQLIWLANSSAGYADLLRQQAGLKRLLESIADTTSDLESYHVFSGSVGIGKHHESFSSIVDTALELVYGRGAGVRSEE